MKGCLGTILDSPVMEWNASPHGKKNIIFIRRACQIGKVIPLRLTKKTCCRFHIECNCLCHKGSKQILTITGKVIYLRAALTGDAADCTARKDTVRTYYRICASIFQLLFSDMEHLVIHPISCMRSPALPLPISTKISSENIFVLSANTYCSNHMTGKRFRGLVALFTLIPHCLRISYLRIPPHNYSFYIHYHFSAAFSVCIMKQL